MRADLFLVDNGLATTRSQAQRLIGAGVHWRPDPGAAWKKVAKNGDEIPHGAEVKVEDTTEARYISRGGLKLEGALQASGVSVQGLRCLDVGQSTGGFTDCLLQHGAAEVVGIDVGHGQLHPSMREDARVVCIEGVNARAITADDLIEHHRRALRLKDGIDDDGDDSGHPGFGDDDEDWDEEHDEDVGEEDEEGDEDGGEETDHGEEADNPAQPAADGFDPVFDFLTGDLSFISLTLVLPAVVRLLKADGHLLMLVKPQFELQPGQVGKGGIVRDPAHFAFVEQRLRDACEAAGCTVLGWSESAIQGGDGNREFFIHAQKRQGVDESAPLAGAPVRKVAKRVPRSELRAHWAPHEDSELANGGQPGPARRKEKKINDY